uniref:Large ribosomal subunit protein uL6 n=1 Tax=uncultured bacterium Rifle_16ft_4_minimus_7469 TaxID=1665162 RepID=A0A0H4TV28_9BACT|nr:50S ribosomal protein L6, large subunit ribosomal protein L6 [uncultured bacterium Rifle_16ft_4_minimus_7469]
MSRIGRLPVVLPKDVDVTVSGRTVEVKGPKGTLSRQVHPDMRVAVADRQLTVSRPTDQRQHRALHGLTRALIANMVKGVVDGFRINLEIQGVGYRATKQGRQVTFQVGYSHPVEITPPPGVEIEVPQPNRIGIVGTDKEQVGQLAARVRAIRPPDPYKGKGIRYADERPRLKAGKAGKAVGKA